MNNYLLKLKPSTAVLLSIMTIFILGGTMIKLGWVPQISILLVIIALLLFWFS